MSAFVVSVALSLSAFAAPPVNPEVVSPTGKQTSVFRVATPGMYRVRVNTDVNVLCALSDPIRGRFTGYLSKCEHDVMLDPGIYKVLLNFPQPKGTSATGRARISVSAFVEDSNRSVQLESGAQLDSVLQEGHQRSFWLPLKKHTHVAFTVAGRTAGVVKLWREGEWIEKVSLPHSQLNIGGNRMVHRWEFSGMLEKGNYRVVVYGAKSKLWTTAETRTRQNRAEVASREDSLFVSRGLPPSSNSGAHAFEIPAWGFVRFAVEHAHIASALILPELPSGVVELRTIGTRKSTPSFTGGQRCSINKSSKLRSCAIASASGSDVVILEVRGPPKTKGIVRTAPRNRKKLRDGLAESTKLSLDFFAPKSAARHKEYLVGTFDLPPDDDAAPLSCSLEELNRSSRRWVQTLAYDATTLNSKRGLHRNFNYHRRKGGSIWFNVDSADTFRITTAGNLSSSCELFGVDDKGETTRLASSTNTHKRRGGSGNMRGKTGKESRMKKQKNCSLSKFLSPGRYLLRLYNGRDGVESLRIATDGAKDIVAGKSTCRMQGVTLRKSALYRIKHSRNGRSVARGLVLRELPLTLDSGLSLSVSKSDPLSLPLKRRGAIVVRATRGTFECAIGNSWRRANKSGVCTVTGSGAAQVLRIRTKSKLSVSIYIEQQRQSVPRRVKGLTTFSPKRAAPLPRLAADREQFFDFERGQQRSFLLDVPRTGLYELESTGLLAMQCRVRTPTVQELHRDSQGGRGRNCLLQGGLSPGKYLLTVNVMGKSKGRAGLRLSTRKSITAPMLRAGERRHQHIAAGSLVVTPFVVDDKMDGKSFNIRISAAGDKMASCRLEDDDGWPLDQAPQTCRIHTQLNSGRYRLVLVPAPIAVTREISVIPVDDVVTIKPTGPVALTLNAPVQIVLGKDATQSRHFSIPADQDVLRSLDNGMMGTLYRRTSSRVGTKKSERGAEVTTLSPLVARGRLPGGPFSMAEKQKRTLAAGDYEFVVRHSRDDVGIEYTAGVSVSALAPGVSLKVGTNASVTVHNPAPGYVRLQSSGAKDVRCRLFDVQDRLLAESSRSGDDWNCAFLYLLDAGTFRLQLETETGRAGQTTIHMSRPKTRKLGALKSGSTIRPGEDTLAILLPTTSGDVVEDISLRSDAALSCALEELDGKVLTVQTDVTHCRLLTWAGPRGKKLRAPLRVRVWQTVDSGGIRYVRQTLPVRAFAGGTLKRKTAGMALVANSGRYGTGVDVRCLSANKRGALLDCSRTAALEKGPHVFATVGKSRAIGLREIFRPAATTTSNVPLSGRAYFERQRSRRRTLHLVDIIAPQGSPASPVCTLENGISRLDAGRCVAATNATKISTLRAFAATKRAFDVDILRREVAVDTATPLTRGASTLTWRDGSAAFTLPESSYRLHATLAAGEWAVLVDDRGRTVDVCAAPRPSSTASAASLDPRTSRTISNLTLCTLRGKGGQLLLVSPFHHSGKARVEVVTLPGPARQARRLTPTQEVVPTSPGTLSFRAPPAANARELHVDSSRNVECNFRRDDGVHQQGCHLAVPPGVSGTFVVDHQGAPLRVRLHRRGFHDVARFARKIPRKLGPPIAVGETTPLTSGLTDRTIAITERSVVRVHADSGVCALFSGRRTLAVSGLGGPCDLSHLVDPGPLRVMVRPFAGIAPHGELYVVKTPIVNIGEGVSSSTWVAPGEERFFRFDVNAPAKIGIGLQTSTDAAVCSLYDRHHRKLEGGCQQYIDLKRGGFLFGVFAPVSGPPLSVRPVLLGTTGTDAEIPTAYLEQLRAKAEETP